MLRPRRWAVFPLLSFPALIFIFVSKNTKSALAYAVYGLSAYSLALCIAAAVRFSHRIRKKIIDSCIVKRIRQTNLYIKYTTDDVFRDSVGVLRRTAVDLAYVVFRGVTGVIYGSAWFLSAAVYHLVLGGIRGYAAFCLYSGGDINACIRKTAWLLFGLNISMGGMILLCILTDSAYSYPGYIIYLSAVYVFYSVAAAIIGLVRFAKRRSRIILKMLNFISALMSVFGLQTALIVRFGGNAENFRRTMNAATGSAVYVSVAVIAVYMLISTYKHKTKKNGEKTREQVTE